MKQATLWAPGSQNSNENKIKNTSECRIIFRVSDRSGNPRF